MTEQKASRGFRYDTSFDFWEKVKTCLDTDTPFTAEYDGESSFTVIIKEEKE